MVEIQTPVLNEAVYEKVRGFHDYNWYLSLPIPAGSTIRVDLVVPKDEIYLETGYEFEPDKLTLSDGTPVFVMSHWHDSRPQFLNLYLTESILSFRYTKPEIVEETFTIVITNRDTSDRTITVLGLYRSIPKAIYLQKKELAKMGV